MEGDSVDLVNRWRDGDEAAATELHQRYFERLLRVVSGQLVNSYRKEFEPEDVLQSAFRTVFKRVSDGEFRFDDDGDVWKLLVTVSLNKLRNRVRYLNAERRDVRREVGGEADFDGYLATQLSQPPGVEEAVEFAELMRTLLELLPESERTVVQLRMDGYSQQEIADQLGVTDRTVRRMWERIQVRVGMLFNESTD